MKPEEKDLLTGFLSKTLNLDAEAISGLFNAEGDLINMDKVLEADATRVAKFKADNKSQHDRGIKEGAEKIEKELKKKYQIESDLIGVELFDHVLETQTAELNDKLTKKTTKDEDFEKHPKYAQLKKDHELALKQKDIEWKAELDKKESEWNRMQTLSKVTKLAFAELEEGYIMPENVQRKESLKEVVRQEIEKGNYRIVNEGTSEVSIDLLDSEGKLLEDSHGHPISYKDHVNGIAAKYFDKKVAQVRGNAGNNGGSTKVDGVFKSKDEFTEAMKTAKTPEEQSALLQKYKASNLN